MQIIWSESAFADLQRISAYLHYERPSSAQILALEVARKLEILEHFPYSGKQTDEDGLREMVFTQFPYSIFYRILPDSIFIVRIFHHAQYH